MTKTFTIVTAAVIPNLVQTEDEATDRTPPRGKDASVPQTGETA